MLETSTPQQQLEQDELYARQLAEHYNASTQRRRPTRDYEQRVPRPPRKETGLKPNELYDDDDREHNFFDGKPARRIRKMVDDRWLTG
jgi:hypothetical protein